MILANVCTARFLLRHKIPALYRVHERPDEDKLTGLREFLGEFGLGLGGGSEPEPRHFAEVLLKVRGRPDSHLIQTVLLRSLKQAHYTPDNVGHFGLAHEAYAHFTSPIRRYPDLLVHRAIRHVLARRKAGEFDYDHEAMVSHGEHCSMTDRRADEATRDAVNWLKCEFMMDKVGDEFDGIITSVTSFGLFIELNEIYVEGLVHVTALGNDYFHFDPVGHRMRGERTGTTYRLGDKVRVKVVRVDLDERKIDFELTGGPARVPEPQAGKAAKAPARRKGKGEAKRKATGRRRTKGGEAKGGKPEPAKKSAAKAGAAEAGKAKDSGKSGKPKDAGQRQGRRRRRAKTKSRDAD